MPLTELHAMCMVKTYFEAYLLSIECVFYQTFNDGKLITVILKHIDLEDSPSDSLLYKYTF